MWPFRRKKEEKKVPEEVQEYYQAEKRERLGLAWILAIVTLAATVLAVLGLFFGGRWAYRKIAHKDKPTTTVQKPKQPEVATNPAKPNDNQSTNNSGSSGTTQSTPAQPNPPSTDTTHQDHSTTAPAGGTSNTPSPSANIPSTGPTDTLAIFAIASVLGFGLNELRIIKRLAKD